jgi:hypothetical protein
MIVFLFYVMVLSSALYVVGLAIRLFGFGKGVAVLLGLGLFYAITAASESSSPAPAPAPTPVAQAQDCVPMPGYAGSCVRYPAWFHKQ